MVGSADGVPALVRHAANRSLLAGQRQQLLAEISKYQNLLRNTHPGDGEATHRTQYMQRLENLQSALQGLDKVEAATADGQGKYLLNIDSLAHGRGQVIIASGNPDTAQHVMRTVPGTYSSLGDAMDYVQRGDAVMHRAEQFAPNQSFASVTYVNYQAPDSLALAGMERWADDGSKGLSQFQEGLRATHEGVAPSHNTVIGHSYGSTEVGFAARDHGLHADDVVFIGSPGVGVEHANNLGMPPDHVWSGTAGLDEIKVARKLDPSDWDPSNDMWFGKNPSDPSFGGRQLPTGFWAGHSDYWDTKESFDGMARIVAGKAG